MSPILMLFLGFKLLEEIFENGLAFLNKKHYENPKNQTDVIKTLQLDPENFKKSLLYTQDKFRFGMISSWLQLIVTALFLALGGFTFIENYALQLTETPLWQGVTFFALLGSLSYLFALPFSYYSVFVIEDKYGFNKQTVRSFFVDQVKGMVVSMILMAPLLVGILYIMQLGDKWWLLAWILVSLFSLFTSWIYPTVLAPLFNKFTPIEDENLRKAIFDLAEKVKFETSGIYIMDASRRSSHGNAYFTGVFGKKRIVLFDTLVKELSVKELVAVLAHELGHFKLHHVRWGLIRSTFLTGFMFYLISLMLPLEAFYHAFGFSGVSNYAGLVVFSMWFGLANFFLSPLSTWISRKNEFAADNFATQNIDSKNDLVQALLKLSEKNNSMPISHPWYSGFHYSHPPLPERIEKMKNK